MDDRDLLPSQRRRFLTVMLAAIGGSLAALTAWPLFRFLAPSDQAGLGGQVEVARKDIAVGQAHFFDFRGKPAVLLQPEAGRYVALTAVCTHLGCIVKWVGEENYFLCPCHGGRFAPTGEVLSGPPPTALQVYPVVLDGDKILVG